MKLSKEMLADMIHDSEGNTLSEEEVSEAIEALEGNALEIEGYEQVKDVGSNVGSNVGSIDGKPLSEGEIALIRAIRRGTRLIDALRQIEKEKEATK